MADNKENQQQRASPAKKKTLRPVSVASSILSSDGFDANCSILNKTQQQNNKQHKLKQRFTVIKKLGKGTYGKVQLAINKETGQEVAIKTIKKTKIENDQDLQRVRREIQIMSSIEHPHIIHIYEVFENKDKIVLIMQYAPGGELYEYVSQSKILDDSEARRLFRQIATAIFYCHQNKICHRDLKLENILLDEKNNAKLADFGLSNVFDKSRQLKTFCGSPLYASPEIVQGSPYEGPEVDCWSLGVLLYTLVYGAMPFDGSNFKRLVKQISDASYYEPEHKSQASALIGRLLCADAKKRATIMDICSDPWVNGAMAPGALSPKSNTQQIAAHTCLLKVAQDMANLTPVRLDILLALTPAAISEAASKIPQNNEPDNDNGEQFKRTQNQDPSLSTFDKPSCATPTLMDVDTGGRATSPVANYVVRDLTMKDNQNNTKQAKEETKTTVPISGSGDEQVDKPDQIEPASMDNCPLSELESTEQHTKEPDIDVEMNAQKSTNEHEQSTTAGSEQGSKTCATLADTKQPDQGAKVSLSTHVEIEPTISNVSIEVDDESQETAMCVDQAPTTTKFEIELAPVEHRQDDSLANKSKPTELVEQSAIEQSKQDIDILANNEDSKEIREAGLPAEQGGDTEQDNSVQVSDEISKPKKKKRIVVVKKKKKVAKKDDDDASRPNSATPLADQSGAKNEIPDETETKAQSNSEQERNNNSKSSDRPGRVKIPENFKPQSDAQEQEKIPKTRKVTGRRQSTLIADVAQKLMQQQNVNGNHCSTSAIDADQQQLASVKVSDKKSEFERRTSLVTSVASSSTNTSPRGSQTMNKIDDNQEAKEPGTIDQAKIETKKEIVSIPSELIDQTTIIEPVLRAYPLGVTLLEKPLSDNTSEPITPTDHSSDSRNLLPLDTKRLREQMVKLEESNSGTIQDERSDSVETIKADKGEQNEISESNTDHDHQNDGRDSSSSKQQLLSNNRTDEQQSLSFGPAPITRSYKKVTFTKDGTCITETGKIYSTQGENGAVRRVERKSKITHYPGDEQSNVFGGGGGGGTREEQVHEEVIIEGDDNEQHWIANDQWKEHSFQSLFSDTLGGRKQSTRHNRPFERLIMPTSDHYDEQSARACSFSKQHNETIADKNDIFRQDSASSCSSGSTDAFDDIFDQWTGAISMFNQPRRLSDLHRSMMQRFGSGSGGHSLLFGPRRRSGSSSSSGRHHRRPQSSAGQFVQKRPETADQFRAGQRCGSVEPTSSYWRPFSTLNRRSRNHAKNPLDSSSISASGYESDVPFDHTIHEQPDSARLSSARGRNFGSTNLFPRHEETSEQRLNQRAATPTEPCGQTSETIDHKFGPFSYNASSLMQEIALEHERLRQKMSERHKKFWKGSTPSLVNVGLDSKQGGASFFDNPLEQMQHPQQSSGRNSSSSHQRPPIGPRSFNQSSTQSLSGSKTSIRASKPLDAAPVRRNTANLAECVSQQSSDNVIQSTSNSTSLSNQFIAMRLNDGTNATELRRTTSNNLSDSKKIVKPSSNQASLRDWNFDNEGQASGCRNQEQPSGAAGLREHPDARIQSWLLDQSATGGNISSISSGSKSSTSDATMPTSSGDNKSQSFQRQQQFLQRTESQATTMTNMTSASMKSKHLPPLALFPSAKVATIDCNQQEQKSSSIVTVKASDSSRSLVKKQHVEQTCQSEQYETESAQMSTSKLGSALQQVSKSVFTFSSSSSTSSRRQTSQIATALNSDNNEQILTPHQQHLEQQQQHHSEFFEQQIGQTLSGIDSGQQSTSGVHTLDGAQDDEFDSMLDHESRSSSSLLDQLRSRGYRSMINQRLVSSSSISTSSSSQQPYFQTKTSTKGQTSSGNQSIGVDSAGVDTQKKPTETTTSVKESHAGCKSTRDCPDVIRSTVNGNDGTGSVTEFHTHTNGLTDNDDAKKNDDNKLNNCDPILELTDKGSDLKLNNFDCLMKRSTVTEDAPENSCMEQMTKGQKELQTGEEMDEDVREAKANIKSYLDRMRETDEFIKSMQKQEEFQERQRQQQLFLFNNLMIGTKLNGSPLSGCTGSITANLGTNIQQRINGIHIDNNQDCGSLFSSDLFRPQMTTKFTGSTTKLTETIYNTHVEPFDPIQPLCMNGGGHMVANKYTTPFSSPACWRRSKSQLSDMFDTYTPSSRATSHFEDQTCISSRRPYSALIQSDYKSSPFFQASSYAAMSNSRPPPNRRSVSQIRQHQHSRLDLLDKNSIEPDPCHMTTEYRNSFGSNLKFSSIAGGARRARSPHRRTTTPLPKSSYQQFSKTSGSENDDDDDDDDIQFSSTYRARSYVPRSRISNSMATDNDSCSSVSRTRDSRPLSNLRNSSLSTKSHYLASDSARTKRQATSPSSVHRRGSLTNDCAASNATSDDEECDKPSQQYRRCSERAVSIGRISNMQMDNPRLTELEQRIQANKKRREQLLAGNLESIPAPVASKSRTVENHDGDDELNFQKPPETSNQDKKNDEGAQEELDNVGRDKNQMESKNTRLTKPSRLKSMEGRIKRKSYCIRVSSPDRPSKLSKATSRN